MSIAFICIQDLIVRASGFLICFYLNSRDIISDRILQPYAICHAIFQLFQEFFVSQLLGFIFLSDLIHFSAHFIHLGISQFQSDGPILLFARFDSDQITERLTAFQPLHGNAFRSCPCGIVVVIPFDPGVHQGHCHFVKIMNFETVDRLLVTFYCFDIICIACYKSLCINFYFFFNQHIGDQFSVLVTRIGSKIKCPTVRCRNCCMFDFRSISIQMQCNRFRTDTVLVFLIIPCDRSFGEDRNIRIMGHCNGITVFALLAFDAGSISFNSPDDRIT